MKTRELAERLTKKGDVWGEIYYHDENAENFESFGSEQIVQLAWAVLILDGALVEINKQLGLHPEWMIARQYAGTLEGGE